MNNDEKLMEVIMSLPEDSGHELLDTRTRKIKKLAAASQANHSLLKEVAENMSATALRAEKEKDPSNINEICEKLRDATDLYHTLLLERANIRRQLKDMHRQIVGGTGGL